MKLKSSLLPPFFPTKLAIFILEAKIAFEPQSIDTQSRDTILGVPCIKKSFFNSIVHFLGSTYAPCDNTNA